MLQAFRQGIGSWFVKGFMGLLILAFVIWGIADVFRNFGTTTLASVGKTQISIEGFRRLFTERLQRLGRQLGRPLTPAEAHVLGIDRQILGELLSEAALDQKAQGLRLAISDDTLSRRIAEDPAFRGPSGTFNHEFFLQLLRANGYTEAQYVSEQRRLMLRQQIASAFTGAPAIPKILGEAVQRFESEERAIEFVRLGKDQAGQIAAPTPEQLKAYYDEHKAAFRAPEYRKIVLIALTADMLAASIEVSDADVQKVYEAQIDRFRTPERRDLDQIVFLNMEEAKAAADRIAAGTSFDKIAEERKLTPKDISIGLVAKRDILDPAIADAAFTLAVGKVSEPIPGRFGAVLLRLKRIEAGVEQPLSAVAATLRKEIARDRARRQILDIHDKVEDERAGGATITETANKLGLKAVTIEAADRSGRKPDGTMIEDVPGRDDLLKGAFLSQPGVETDPVELRNQGGFVWYEVAGITPARDRTFEEARGLVEARWREEETGKKLATLADTIRAKIDSGESFAKAVPGVAVEHREKIRRGGKVEGLDADAIARIFATTENKAGVYAANDGTGWIVYRILKVNIPPFAPTPAALKAITSGLEDDLLGQYVLRLEHDLGVSINEAALRSITGSDRN
ncbi:MAG TPA: SurA N-terminal domain-containing protein [Xanthobacteraceae bacterium]|nr:SurA N-terminal domain-containing protein [Xanthobacteraceae bacterium]